MAVCGKYTYALLTFLRFLSQSLGQSYTETMAIFSDKMSSDKYSVDVRPVQNQSQVLIVGVSFELLAIVDLNDVSQSFNCNGFVAFLWTDEILTWNPDSYGGQTSIHPQAKNIWRPRVILVNTLGERDIFEDDNADGPTIANLEYLMRIFKSIYRRSILLLAEL